MKILVAVKRVVDYNIKVRPKSDGTDVDIANAKMSMNPFDEIAVEEAIRLKEKGIATEVIIASIGPKSAQETIRAGLALGADRGIHIATEEKCEPLHVAKLLQKIISQESCDIVILGKQAIDDDCNQTGQMLAALLNWPQGTFASKVEKGGSGILVTREIDGGLETIDLKLPAIITTDLRLNEPRYAKLPDIMKSKQKPMAEIAADTLGIDLKPRLRLIQVCEPPVRQAGIKVESVDQLIDKLKNEAHVI